VIRLEKVSKSYRTSTRPALDQVTVDVGKGEFVFLIGPSGSGKSTFLRLLLREDVPTKGDVFVADWNVAKLPRRKVPRLRQRVGCVFQDFRLLQNKSVAENVAFALEVIGKQPRTIQKVVPEVLELVGLQGKANRMPNELSGGEQQRVAVARAFVNRPLVLLADEPTGNLDTTNGHMVLELLIALNRREGTTLVLVTHDGQVSEQADRRITLRDGRVVEDA
jgi:cell division transport system ATP-binding protein